MLVETGIVDDHVVDGGLVDEHVVDGLVDDHEEIANRQESLGKSSKILFLFVMARCVYTGFSYCRRERWSLCGLPAPPELKLTANTHPSLQICSKCIKSSQSVLTKIRRKIF
jgi:hypothetical protein